tara:strand:- start:317 stop:445 length:129 start_codon:yes stop_codon:yes gene_type:complete
MKKNIYTILILLILMGSCGKKSDPVYQEQKSGNMNTKIKVVL